MLGALERASGGNAIGAWRGSRFTFTLALYAWGSGGDAFPLMLSVKQQFDRRGTLNPGRFIGGI